MVLRITPVYADLDKTVPGQPNTKPAVANWGGNRFVSNDFFQVQPLCSQLWADRSARIPRSKKLLAVETKNTSIGTPGQTWGL